MAAKTLPRFLTPPEVAEMFKSAVTFPRDNMILKCLYYLGLRNSELRSLRVEDIDSINRTVKVIQGKGKKDRYVPIPGDFAAELRAFISGKSSGLLFEGRNEDGALSDRHLRRIVKEYARLANVRKHEEVHPHTLRHSYATHLQNSGVPLNIIQNMLGHTRLETTAIYTHMGIDRAREFIDHAFKIRYGEKPAS
jgi:site-specific recombinase XerD